MREGVRLNLFQRMMIRWRDLHPYNPVHVARVSAALEPERLRACIAQRLEALGVTGVRVDRVRWRLRYYAGPANVDLVVIGAGNDPQAELNRAIERQFNLPFAGTAHESPFRFIAVDEGDAFQLLLVYDHFVASGDSIAQLLTGIACSYTGHVATAAAPPPRRSADTYRSVFLHHPMWAARALFGLPRLLANGRRAYRPPYVNVQDAHNAFTCILLGREQTSVLLATAKAWDVTFNDLLMACLLIALSPLTVGRRRERRRNQIAIASILNMRRDFQPDAHDALSPSLAAFRVSHAVPDGIGLRHLAQDLHTETARIKRGHLYLQSIIALGVTALMWPRLSVPRQHALYPKHFPASAGVTSFNVNPLWDQMACADTARLDYLRAVPTGPLCPLVLAVTTAHDKVHVGVAFRTAAYSHEAISALLTEFRRCIDQLNTEPSA